MSDAAWLCKIEKTQDAVRDYARAKIRSLARRAIYRLQRLEASDIYGSDYKFKSLWDEYCHEVQDGPYDLLTGAWDDVLSKTLKVIIDGVPREAAVFLTILAVGDLDEDEGADLIGSVWAEGIARLLHEQLADEAGSRGLDHLNPL